MPALGGVIADRSHTRLIHLIRHARPSRTGIVLGRLDEPLSDQRIAPSPLDASVVYSSPLRRALHTARAMFPSRHLVVIPELAECGAGEWEGLPWDRIASLWPEESAAKTSNWARHTPPGGEPWESFTARVIAALDRIRGGHFPAVVVAHAGVNAVLAARLRGSDPFEHKQDYCEVITIELFD